MKAKPKRKLNRLSDTKKREILGLIARKKLTVKQASEQYKIAPSGIYRWQKQWGFNKENNNEENVEPKKDTIPVAVEAQTVTLSLDTRNDLDPIAQLLVEHQRRLYELRINQLERENKRLALLVESLTDTIGEFAANAD